MQILPMPGNDKQSSGNCCKIVYKNQTLAARYIADLLCYEQIVVELKALNQLGGREEAQIINYLKVTGLKVGLLINFGHSGKLEWKRFVN